MTRPTVAIIGAGPAGLTAALELVRKGGFKVVVFEADEVEPPRVNIAVLADPVLGGPRRSTQSLHAIQLRASDPSGLVSTHVTNEDADWEHTVEHTIPTKGGESAPRHVDEIIDVPLPRPRSFDMEGLHEFQDCAQRIRSLIFGRGGRSLAGAA